MLICFAIIINYQLFMISQLVSERVDASLAAGDGDIHLLAISQCHVDLIVEYHEPAGGVEHHASFLIDAHQDAALGVLWIIAHVDADARESRHIEQQWQWPAKLLRACHHHLVSALWYGSFAQCSALASALSHLLSVLSFVYITIMVHSSLLAVLRFLQSGVLISNRWCKGTAVRILIKRMHFIKRLKDISSSDDSFYNL